MPTKIPKSLKPFYRKKYTSKKKKSKRLKQGIFEGKKAKNLVKYKSGWELAAAKYFDDNENVEEYFYEPVAIEYLSNKSTGKIRKYFPDFLVHYKNGTKKLIEIKPKRKKDGLAVRKKSDAARMWCSSRGIKFEIWSEEILLPLVKLYSI